MFQQKTVGKIHSNNESWLQSKETYSTITDRIRSKCSCLKHLWSTKVFIRTNILYYSIFGFQVKYSWNYYVYRKLLTCLVSSAKDNRFECAKKKNLKIHNLTFICRFVNSDQLPSLVAPQHMHKPKVPFLSLFWWQKTRGPALYVTDSHCCVTWHQNTVWLSHEVLTVDENKYSRGVKVT